MPARIQFCQSPANWRLGLFLACWAVCAELHAVPPVPITFEVVSPTAIAGQYYAVEADPGLTLPLAEAGPVTGIVVYAEPPDLCGPALNAAALHGNIALIDRDTCLFSDKIQTAQNAGAIAAIIVNNIETKPIVMAGTNALSIPGLMISQADGALLKAHLAEQPTVRLTPTAPSILSPLVSGVWLEGTATNLQAQVNGGCLQWIFNGQPIPGATNDLYAIGAVTATNAGSYLVIATNALGSVTNGPVTLGVYNVETSNFFALMLTAPSGTPLQVQSAPDIRGPWSALADLNLANSPFAYVDPTANTAPQRFYRTTQPDRLAARLLPGWNFTAPAGSQQKIEYVDGQVGFTNWQLLTNLTLPASPCVFVDTGATNPWPRFYRIPSETLSHAWQPAEMKLVGDWQVEVTFTDQQDATSRVVTATLTVPPLTIETVTNELYVGLPMFDPAASGWVRGQWMYEIVAVDCTVRYALDPASVKVSSGTTADATVYERGKDYEVDDAWATVGRLPASRIGANETVYISYHYVKQRIDSVVLTKTGSLVLRQGDPHIATPVPPAIATDEIRVANIWLSDYRTQRLTTDQLFPMLETAFPAALKTSPLVTEESLPHTLDILRTGKHLKILAWGDSVTECAYLPFDQSWQVQFVQRLQARFPQAQIELVTQGWGGKASVSFLDAPPGHIHNYQEQVLGAKPDLVISEFVNDSALTPALVEQYYGKYLADFQAIGAEWIILTPHYITPDWMGLPTRELDVDNDPRPYVQGLREFAARHQVALGDTSLRYGRLWRQGLPFITFIANNLNHPSARGMSIFADSLMTLFP